MIHTALLHPAAMKTRIEKGKQLFACALLPHLDGLDRHAARVALAPRGEPVVDALVEGAGCEEGGCIDPWLAAYAVTVVR